MQGSRLGPYRLDRELGSGGMGTVWRAEGPDGVVAMKVVHAHVAATPGFLERFLREGAVGRSVRHENVVATLATGEDRCENGVQHWIALEYVEGQTLRGLADEMGTVPEELCRHVGREIAKGLAAIHGAGLVHRDVKPENVLITRDHVVKVMDLGIARGADDEQRMTATGMFVGSVQYAAPEQFTGGGRGLDARADLHALGVTLYELATGVQPFEAEDVSTTLRNVLHSTPRRAGEVNPQLSAFFEEVLRTLLEKDREKRFASAGDLLDALTGGEDSAWWAERARAIRAATRKPLRRIRIPRETALYGREAELAKLRAAYERAVAGEGAVLLVEGEAGIGKSRLVDEFVGGLAQAGEDVNFLFGGYPPGGAATASGAFSTAWREHYGNDEDALRAALPEQPLLVPAFAALLRGDAPPKDAEPLTKDSLQTVLVRSAQSLAKERTTIVLVEDLHFAPEEGRALFASLAMAAPGHRILLVGTTRPGLDERWTANVLRVGAEKVLVPRLGPADLVKLLTDALKSEHLATDLGAQIALKSDGNPFFVFEILRGLREGLFLTRRDDGTWATTRRIEDIRIPPSIAELIQARVSDLGDDDRNLLEVAACVGFEFDPGLVGAVLGLPPIPALQRLGAIEKRTRLVRAAGKRLVFDHHQVQEHLYSGILESLREQYHAAIGEALEARLEPTPVGRGEPSSGDVVAICEHMIRGASGARARRYLEPAIDHLTRRAEHARCVRLVDRFLAAPAVLTGTARAGALLALCGVFGPLETLGELARQHECATEADAIARATDDVAVQQAAAFALGWSAFRRGSATDGVVAMQRALDIARARRDRAVEAEALGCLGNMLDALEPGSPGRERYERQLAIALDIGDPRVEVHARLNLGTVAGRERRWDEATRQFEGALAASRRAEDRRGEAQAVLWLVWAFGGAGRRDQIETMLERAHALGRSIGAPEVWVHAAVELALCRTLHGRLAESRALAQEAVTASRSHGLAYQESRALGLLGGLAADLGDIESSVRAWDQVLAMAGSPGADARMPAYADEGLAEVAISNGDFLLASDMLGRAVRRAQESEPLDFPRLAAWLARAATLAHRRGDTGSAATLADAAAAAARSGAPVEVCVEAHALLATIPGHEATAAIEALASAGAAADSRLVRLLLWQATRDRAHLVQAKRLLDELLAKNPPEFHEAMRTRVRVNREILAACESEGIA